LAAVSGGDSLISLLEKPVVAGFFDGASQCLRDGVGERPKPKSGLRPYF